MPIETPQGAPRKFATKELYSRVALSFGKERGSEYDTLAKEGLVYEDERKLRAARWRDLNLDTDEIRILSLSALDSQQSGSDTAMASIADLSGATELYVKQKVNSLIAKLHVVTVQQAVVVAEAVGALPLTVPQSNGVQLSAELLTNIKPNQIKELSQYWIEQLIFDLSGNNPNSPTGNLGSEADMNTRRHRIKSQLGITQYPYNELLILTRFFFQKGGILTDSSYKGYVIRPSDIITASGGIYPPFSKDMIGILLSTARYFAYTNDAPTTHPYDQTSAIKELNTLLGTKKDHFGIERFVLALEGKEYSHLPEKMNTENRRKVQTLEAVHEATLAEYTGRSITQVTGEKFIISPLMEKIITAVKNGAGTVFEISNRINIQPNDLRTAIPQLLSILGIKTLREIPTTMRDLESKTKEPRKRRIEPSPALYGYYRQAEPGSSEPPPPFLTIEELYIYMASLPNVRRDVSGLKFFTLAINDRNIATRIDIDLNDPASMAQFGIIVDKQPFQLERAPGIWYVRDIVGPHMIKLRQVDAPDE